MNILQNKERLQNYQLKKILLYEKQMQNYQVAYKKGQTINSHKIYKNATLNEAIVLYQNW